MSAAAVGWRLYPLHKKGHGLVQSAFYQNTLISRYTINNCIRQIMADGSNFNDIPGTGSSRTYDI